MQPVCPVLVTGMLRSADLSNRRRSVPYPVPKTGTSVCSTTFLRRACRTLLLLVVLLLPSCRWRRWWRWRVQQVQLLPRMCAVLQAVLLLSIIVATLLHVHLIVLRVPPVRLPVLLALLLLPAEHRPAFPPEARAPTIVTEPAASVASVAAAAVARVPTILIIVIITLCRAPVTVHIWCPAAADVTAPAAAAAPVLAVVLLLLMWRRAPAAAAAAASVVATAVAVVPLLLMWRRAPAAAAVVASATAATAAEPSVMTAAAAVITAAVAVVPKSR
jgi:hypothetical protein